jgi:hypothetical protein
VTTQQTKAKYFSIKKYSEDALEENNLVEIVQLEIRDDLQLLIMLLLLLLLLLL